ncbi:MAG: hypothetical protein ACRDTH_02200 [Pseudonocardiaceae bacterium]
MSVFEMTADRARQVSEARLEPPPSYETSPFAAASLCTANPLPAAVGELPAGQVITTPFAESLASFDESDLEAEAFDALRAEFEDEEFFEALEALVDEAAARHLTAAGSWRQESEAFQLESSEAEQWMEAVAAQADRLLGELEARFGDRPVDAVTEAEIDAVVGFSEFEHERLDSPVDAQEQFLKKLVSKVKKVVTGVGKLVKKGIGAVTKLLPLGKLFGFLKKLVRPLLERVLQKAIGKLPKELQPIATKLAARFTKGASASAGKSAPADASAPATPTAPDPAEGESPWSAESLADAFDARLAEAILAPNDAVATELLAEFEAESRGAADFVVDGPLTALDVGRQRLARQLVEAEPGRPPLAEMEQFIPVVMAAMKLIKLGVKVIGRKRVVDFIAKLLATLIQGMVGEQAARQLSGHVADAGLRLLGLEAERTADGMLGAEALVATTEDTIREVMALPAESLENELLLEAAVQDAFTAAAIRHFPAKVLRPDLVESETDGEHGIWVMFPRAARPHYRYKKYTVIQPVRITRPLARSVTFADGETLEDRLLDAGAHRWPIQGEAHFYELLSGAEFGHLAAFELDGEVTSYSEAALEFEELAPSRPLPIPHPQSRGRGAAPQQGRSRKPGTRVFHLKVPGLRQRHRHPFALRLDLTAAKPELRVHLRVSERIAHQLVEHLEKQRLVQVVATIRKLVGAPVQQALASRLQRLLTKRGITLPEGAGAHLSAALAEAIARAVAKQLPAAAATLTTAAKDPAPGVTLTFGFSFEDREAIGRGEPGDPTLTIRSGVHRD